MGRLAAWSMIATSVSGSLVACSLMLGEGYTGGGEPPDAKSDDVSVAEASVGDATVVDTAAPGVIFREDFEQGCGAWDLDDVTLSSVAGHTGMGCRMCTIVEAASSLSIEKNLQGVKAGETFTLEVWIHRPTAGPEKLDISLESEINGGNPKEQVSTSFASGWQKIVLEHTTVAGIQYLVVHIGAFDGLRDECVDVDEIVVAKK